MQAKSIDIYIKLVEKTICRICISFRMTRIGCYAAAVRVETEFYTGINGIFHEIVTGAK